MEQNTTPEGAKPATLEIVKREIHNPFPTRRDEKDMNLGTVAVEEQRAIAETQGKLIIAKRFPRDENLAFASLMNSCKRSRLAEEATYAFPRGGGKVSGPSIRLAEEAARCWGNIDYGIRELSRKDGVSEMQAYAWDMQTNTISCQNFTVKHLMDRSADKGGSKVLTDERDIYEITANMGARRLRARILAVLPPDLIDAAVEQCRLTLAGDSDIPLEDRVRKMLRDFDGINVTAKMLEKKLGHSLDTVNTDEMADLKEIFNAIKNGISNVDQWFGEAPTGKSRKEASATFGEEKKDPQPPQESQPSQPSQQSQATQQQQPAPSLPPATEEKPWKEGDPIPTTKAALIKIIKAKASEAGVKPNTLLAEMKENGLAKPDATQITNSDTEELQQLLINWKRLKCLKPATPPVESTPAPQEQQPNQTPPLL